MSALLIILIVVWVALGLIATLLLQGWFKRPAPFGVLVDYVIGVIACLAVGLLDFLVFMPAFGFERTWIRALGSSIEAPFGTWLVLWALRQLKGAPVEAE